jgi:hypothetical protein
MYKKSFTTFEFQINNFITKRQGGQAINVAIAYKYRGNDYPNYLDLREITINILNNFGDENTFWEYIAQEIGNTLYDKYIEQITGITVKLTVLPHTTNNNYEPGLHGPTYTIGDI